MKSKTILIVVSCVFFALIFNSCKKPKVEPVPPVLKQDLETTYTGELAMPANAVTIFNALPGGPLPNQPFFNIPFPTNTDAELASAGFTKDKILEIKGESMVIRVLNPASGNMDFMDNIEVFVQDQDGNNKTLYAHKYNYGLGLKTLNMDMTGNDVKEVFRADTAVIVFTGSKRSATSNIQAGTEIEFETKVITTVNAN